METQLGLEMVLDGFGPVLVLLAAQNQETQRAQPGCDRLFAFGSRISQLIFCRQQGKRKERKELHRVKSRGSRSASSAALLAPLLPVGPQTASLGRGTQQEGRCIFRDVRRAVY